MRWILDANALIYLIKSDLAELFQELTEEGIIIDTSVHHEVVTEGIRRQYPDAHRIQDFLEQNQIPIIPIDISSDFNKFRDEGETSCYLLAKEGGTCISSDVRANKKFEKFMVPSIQLDMFFYNQYIIKKINKQKFELILDKLEEIYATTPERKYFLLLTAEQERRKK